MKFWRSFFLFSVIVMSVFILKTNDAHAGREDFAVVVNKNNPIVSVKAADLRRMYKKTKQVWKHGGLIIPIDLEGPLFQNFYDSIFTEKKFEVDIYWMKQIFTRSLKPPLKKKSSESVKKFVSSNKNAIGYIPIGDLDDTVKELKIK